MQKHVKENQYYITHESILTCDGLYRTSCWAMCYTPKCTDLIFGAGSRSHFSHKIRFFQQNPYKHVFFSQIIPIPTCIAVTYGTYITLFNLPLLHSNLSKSL